MSQAPLFTHEIEPLSDLQVMQLLAGLNPNRVQELSKPGSGKLSYVAAWDIRRTLIRVFGFGGWSLIDPVVKVDLVERDIPKSSGNGTTNFRVTTTVTVTLYIHQLGAMYAGTATASQSGSVIGDVQDFAIKTADSDAFKRAAMNLGTQFGLSLYDHGSTADVVQTVLADGQRRIDLVEMELVRKVRQAEQEQRIATLQKRLEELSGSPAAPPVAAQPVEQPTATFAPGDSDTYIEEEQQPAPPPAPKAAPRARKPVVPRDESIPEEPPVEAVSTVMPNSVPPEEEPQPVQTLNDAAAPDPEIALSVERSDAARESAVSSLAGAFGGARPEPVQ